MTDEQISRVIANFIEPLSSLPDVEFCDFAEMEAYDSKCWIASQQLSKVTLMHVPEWQPRDFVNDPACTLMLMNQRGFIGVVHGIEQMHEGQFSATFNGAVSKWTKPLGRAVAEAFCKANGLGESQ